MIKHQNLLHQQNVQRKRFANKIKSLNLKNDQYIKSFNLLDVTLDDYLIVIDMQNDFVKYGTFAVKDGEHTIASISRLIEDKSKFKNIIATRDWHPENHVSFKAFPKHCVQNTEGADFVSPVKNALYTAIKYRGKNIYVGYKGFDENIDSFGAFKYNNKTPHYRLTNNKEIRGKQPPQRLPCEHCNSMAFTGAFYIEKHNRTNRNIQTHTNSKINDYVNLRTISNVSTNVLKTQAKPISNIINNQFNNKIRNQKNKTRFFICGLAADYCVLDTAVNLRRHLKNQYPYDVEKRDAPIYIIIDLTRYAFVQAFGGYLHNNESLQNIYKKYNIYFCQYVA